MLFRSIIGDTGSGKSTLVDILMGLLSPESGSIKIDHVELSTPLDLARWRDKVSHVPQSIFLADATIKENIAFGVDIADIDESRIKEVADLSCLGEFINNLPLGFETIIGENGALISGGQRQRIGIARALYRKAEVIVFDEATSALDGRTEAKIIQGIESLDKNVTIFMIAHRISTLKNCNSILRVANKGIEKVDYKSLVGSM